MKKPWSLALMLGATVAMAFACEKPGEQRQARNVTPATAPLTIQGEGARPKPVPEAPTTSDTLPAAPPAANGLAIADLPAPSATAAPAGSKGAGGSAATGPVGPTSLGPDATGAGVTKLTPGQLLHFADTANAGEIEQARKALSKAHDAEVRSFANLMLTEHTQSKEVGRALAQKLGVTLAGNTLSADLTKRATKLDRPVAATPGDRFDRAYMREQVELHAYVLKTLDEEITPQATNADVKAYLTDLRAHVVHHLEVARTTSERLGSGATAESSK